MFLYEKGVHWVVLVGVHCVVKKIFETPGRLESIYILRNKTRAGVGLDTFLFERSDPGAHAGHHDLHADVLNGGTEACPENGGGAVRRRAGAPASVGVPRWRGARVVSGRGSWGRTGTGSGAGA